MANHQLDGLVFSQAEMLVLLDAVKAPDLVGISADGLLPAERETHQHLVLKGIELLKGRGLLTVQDDINVLQPELVMIARVVARPQMVTLVARDDPGLGQRQFLFYQVNQYIVEHTMPAEGAYRFAFVPNTAAQLERMEYVLPLGQGPESPSYELQMPREAFFRAREATMAGSSDGASSILGEYASASAVSALAGAMQAPVFSGTVAYMHTEDSRILDAYNLAVLQGESSAWIVEPVKTDEAAFAVRTIPRGQFREVLYDGLVALLQSVAPEAA